ncbi:MAG: TetR/AcrR family transcriptional regulator [Bacillaceae bacterium]|nr:TetR/AcrR family transcriptional regulator [Bacillaceae bacterium]
MRDTSEKILEAAREVFVREGFLQATTQEIAKEAGVAEMTVFRKFSTKKNLFYVSMKAAIENNFYTDFKKLAPGINTEKFLSSILKERLETVSKNIPIIRMLISESMMSRLDEEIDLPKLIFYQLKSVLQQHFDKIGADSSVEELAKMISGILISQTLWTEGEPFFAKTEQEKETIVQKHVQSLMAFIHYSD